MARIDLKNMSFYAHHGCFEQEQTIGTWFRVDAWYDTCTKRAEQTDDIADTVSYLEVYQVIKREMERPAHLLEHVARRIADEVLRSFPAIDRIGVSVSKMAPPLGGQLEAVSVSLEQGRHE